MQKPKKLPRDPNALAARIVAISTGQVESETPTEGKNPAAVALGRLGGLKGGPARAAKLTAKQRKEIGEKASETRWRRKSG